MTDASDAGRPVEITPPIASGRPISAAARLFDRYFHYLALAPTVLTLVALTVFPTLFLIYVVFHKISAGNAGAGEFVGLDNFIRLASDPVFGNALINTLVFTVFTVAIEFVLGLGLALLLQRLTRGASLIKTFLLIPMMLPPVAVAISWKLMLQPEFGVVNDILYRTGIEGFLFKLGLIKGPILWASGEATAMLSIIIVDVWQWTPFVFLMFLAGIASLPTEPYEAADLDGASAWRQFWDITWPLLRPITALVLLLRILDAFRIFDNIYVITRGGPAGATDTLSYYLYRVAFRNFDLGYAAAVSIVMLVAAVLFSTWMLARMGIDFGKDD
jgi:multiple sugar transport system permease protein